MAPGPGENRKAAERSEEHGSLLMVLGADQGPDEALRCGAVGPGQLFDLIGLDAADLRRSDRIPRCDMGSQLFEAQGMLRDVLVIDQVVPDQDVHHAQHQGDVGAGERLDRPVCGLGGDGADRVDDHDPGPVRPGLLDERPKMAVGEASVGPP